MSSPERVVRDLLGILCLASACLVGCSGGPGGAGGEEGPSGGDIEDVAFADVPALEDTEDADDSSAADIEDVQPADVSQDGTDTDTEPDASEDSDGVDPSEDADAGDDASPDVPDTEDVSGDTAEDAADTANDARVDTSDVAEDVPDDAEVTDDIERDAEVAEDGDADAADVAEATDPDTADLVEDTEPDAADVVEDVPTDVEVVEDIDDDADAPDVDVVDDIATDTGPPVPIYALSYVDHTVASGVTGPQWTPTPSASDNLCGEVSLLTGGAAVEDYDDDGDLDIFIPRLGLPAQLWTNQGDGTFIDRAADVGINESELSNGAAWFDADGDGTFELFVSQVMGLNRLWKQTESGDWVDVARIYGLDGADVYAEQECQRVFGFQVGRLNSDAVLDVILTRWGARFTFGATQVLFGAEGDGWTPAYDTGFTPDGRTTTFTSHIFDFVGDDANDIYLTADFGRSRVYANREGVFSDITETYTLGTEENGMGTAIGDLNGDGLLDLFVTSIYGNPDVDVCNGTWGCSGNRLYFGNGDGFTDVTEQYGVREGGWGWGAVMLDADNDGDTDLAMVNGYDLLWEDESLALYRERSAIFNTDPSRLWRNDGGAPLTEIAVESAFVSYENERAIVPFDMDRDGDLDFIVIRNAGAPGLLEAQTDALVSGVSVRFRGRADHGVNSVVTLMRDAESVPLTGYLRPFGLQASSRPHEVHFGLGEDAPAVFGQISVVFEDGATAEWNDVTSAPLITLDLAEADAVTP